MSLARRFNPFRPDAASLSEPPFDPRQQSWAMGALSALETLAGMVLALPGLASAAFVGYWLAVKPSRRGHFHLEHFTLTWLVRLLTSSVLAAALLWAGLSLMFGLRSRYRAHGALGLVLVAFAASYAADWLSLSSRP